MEGGMERLYTQRSSWLRERKLTGRGWLVDGRVVDSGLNVLWVWGEAVWWVDE